MKNNTLRKRILHIAKKIEELEQKQIEKTSAFMKPEIFKGGMWKVTDSKGESYLFPANYFGKENAIKEVGGGKAELKKGWFGRYSAPGYLDATDWCGPFNSEKECFLYLQEMYGDDDEDIEEDEAAVIESEPVTEPVPPPVPSPKEEGKKEFPALKKAIFALVHNLTDYNQKQYLRDLKKGRPSNAHNALALLLQAEERAVKGATDLDSLVKGIEREFDVEYPPVKKTLKQITLLKTKSIK
jgi:hypothetical protein